jgi:hypothetical protein
MPLLSLDFDCFFCFFYKLFLVFRLFLVPVFAAVGSFLLYFAVPRLAIILALPDFLFLLVIHIARLLCLPSSINNGGRRCLVRTGKENSGTCERSCGRLPIFFVDGLFAKRLRCLFGSTLVANVDPQARLVVLSQKSDTNAESTNEKHEHFDEYIQYIMCFRSAAKCTYRPGGSPFLMARTITRATDGF